MENDIIKKLVKFAFISAFIGVVTVGICPAFGIMGITVGLVLKHKGVELDKESAQKIKYSYIMGGVSLVFFVVDIIILMQFVK